MQTAIKGDIVVRMFFEGHQKKYDAAFGEGCISQALDELNKQYGEMPEGLDSTEEDAECLRRQRAFVMDMASKAVVATTCYMSPRDGHDFERPRRDYWVNLLTEDGSDEVELSGEVSGQFPTAYATYLETVLAMNDADGSETLPVADGAAVRAEVAKLSEFVESEKLAGIERQIVIYPTGASKEHMWQATKNSGYGGTDGDFFDGRWITDCEEAGVKLLGEKTEAGFAVVALPVCSELKIDAQSNIGGMMKRRELCESGEVPETPNVMESYMYHKTRLKAGKEPIASISLVRHTPVYDSRGHECGCYTLIFADKNGVRMTEQPAPGEKDKQLYVDFFRTC